jgi:hypothetical protein
MLRAILSTWHFSLVLLALRDWMYSRVAAWEEAAKALTESEKMFLRTTMWLTKYWYVLAFDFFLATVLVLTAATVRKQPTDIKFV